MNKISWIFHVAKRYFLTKRKEKGHTASILSIMGIAVGVMTLISVIAVMNGFQQGFITSINEIRSFHIRINSGKILSDDVKDEILANKEINAITPFIDIETIIRGFFDDQRGASVRAVEQDILLKDCGLADKLTMTKGSFDLSGEHSLVLGGDLASRLGVGPGDIVNLLSLAGKGYEKLSPVNIEFTVKGIFHSTFYEIDSTMAFISLDDAYLFAPESDYVYGIKLNNHYRDREALWKLKQISALDELHIESWRDYNRSFFSALLMEKVMMMTLISLIFVVVAVNIFHSMKRSVVERVTEIALMKAVGAAPFSVQSVFIIEGAMIGILGSSLGAVLGYILSININSIFNIAENIINSVTFYFSEMAGRGGSINEVQIYTGASYFLQDVPIKIMTGDVVYITSMAFFSALAAAWFASRGVATIKPTEVLRYE